MLEIILIALAFLAGIAIGTLAGLIPGLHINLILPFLLLLPLSSLSSYSIIAFLVSLSITYSFISFIPSILLGCPDDDTSLSVLPGHEMLNKGNGFEAIILTLYGSLLGILLIFPLSLLVIFIFPKIYLYIKPLMFLILIFVSGFLIFKEKNSKTLALLIFFLSGFLGIASFNLTLKNSLLPLLSGLFGSSSLITSIMKKAKLPKQKIISIKKIKPTKNDFFLAGIASLLSAPLFAFLPSLGSGQSAVISSSIIEDINRKRFLMLLGSINAIISGLSFIVLYSINKARTGASATLNELSIQLTSNHLFSIFIIILLSSVFSFFLVLFLSKQSIKLISKINYRLLSLGILIFLSLIVFIFSGFLGFLLFFISTAVGLTAILLGIRRTHLMGSLMLPSILLYLPFL